MAGSLVRNATNYIVDLPILLFRQYANVASIPSEWIALGFAAPILVVVARIKTPFYAWCPGLLCLALPDDAGVRCIHLWRRWPARDDRLERPAVAGPGSWLRPSGSAAAGRSAALNRERPYLIPFAPLLVFGLPALVKARMVYRMHPKITLRTRCGSLQHPLRPRCSYSGARTPKTDAFWWSHPSFFDRSAIASVSIQDLTQALDYAATNAPGTLLGVRKRPQGGFISPLLFDGSDLFKHRKSDARVRLAPINKSFFRVDRWWPDPARGGAP